MAEYLRAQGLPVLVWLDDFYITTAHFSRALGPEEQYASARQTTSLALCVFYRAGYFMSVSKCVFEPTTRLVFLGVICDSDLQRVEAPPDKLEKLEAVLKVAISARSICIVPFWGSYSEPKGNSS